MDSSVTHIEVIEHISDNDIVNFDGMECVRLTIENRNYFIPVDELSIRIIVECETEQIIIANEENFVLKYKIITFDNNVSTIFKRQLSQ